jgi:hypothetical protein
MTGCTRGSATPRIWRDRLILSNGPPALRAGTYSTEYYRLAECGPRRTWAHPAVFSLYRSCAPRNPATLQPRRDTTEPQLPLRSANLPKTAEVSEGGALNFFSVQWAQIRGGRSHGQEEFVVNMQRTQEYELLAESIEGLWFRAELAPALAFGASPAWQRFF